jgi:hypothetical protein
MIETWQQEGGVETWQHLRLWRHREAREDPRQEQGALPIAKAQHYSTPTALLDREPIPRAHRTNFQTNVFSFFSPFR